jgi:hypothetical protein
MTYHRATKEQWDQIGDLAICTHTVASCILELGSRIEKLEAERGAWKAVEKLYEENGKGLKQLAEIEAAERFSPLMGRVARAICESCNEDPDHNGDARGNTYRWMDYAECADVAIREVAVWLREYGFNAQAETAKVLEMEIKR